MKYVYPCQLIPGRRLNVIAAPTKEPRRTQKWPNPLAKQPTQQQLLLPRSSMGSQVWIGTSLGNRTLTLAWVGDSKSTFQKLKEGTKAEKPATR